MDKQAATLQIDQYHIPIFVIKEIRSSIRFSITKKGMVIRLPVIYNEASAKDKAKIWCKQLIVNKPGALSTFYIKEYNNRDTLNLMGVSFILFLSVDETLTFDKLTWKNEEINITLSKHYNLMKKNEIIKYLLSKFAAKRFLKPISNRVIELNNLYFKSTINKIRIKNNHSNWGSCSSKGNVNLATKLLFAPLEVIDYVIIHELAHTKEMNHSKNFWNWVGKACPEYKKHEKWLKENRHLCVF